MSDLRLVEAYSAHTGDYKVIGIFTSYSGLAGALENMDPVNRLRVRISYLEVDAIVNPTGRKYENAKEYLGA